MKNDEKLITIIVPAYNAGKFITQCLESLLHQTLNNHKVIIVDDGSTDGLTAQICKKYVNNYPEMFQYIWQKNQMQGAARNHAIPLVNTEFVGFLDSDDWLPPTYIETLTRELLNYQSEHIDIVFTSPIIYDNATQSYVPWYDHEKFQEIFCEGNKVTSVNENPQLYYLEPNPSMRLYRMNFLATYGYKIFPEGVKWEDLYPHFTLLYHAKKCIWINETGFFYRTNTSEQTTAQNGKSRLDIIPVFNDIFKFAEENHCDIEFYSAAIRKLNIFAKWCIDVSIPDVRKQLVKELSILYNTHRHYKKECAFVITLKSKHLHCLLNDYLFTDLCMGLVRKIRRSK